MHKIAGLFLAVTLISISSFSQSAPPKPAASPRAQDRRALRGCVTADSYT